VPSSMPSISLQPSRSSQPSLGSCVPESACNGSTGEISSQSCRGLIACQLLSGESE
jgi:hypothetical protein